MHNSPWHTFRRLHHTFAVAVSLFCAAVPGRAAALDAGPHKVHLAVAGSVIPGKEVVWDGREVYLPLDALQPLSISARVGSRGDVAMVTLADGRRLQVAVARPLGQPMLPLSEFAEAVGVTYRVSQETCYLLPLIRKVLVQGNRIEISTALPVRPQIHSADASGTIIVSLPGAAIAASLVPGQPKDRTGILRHVDVRSAGDTVDLVLEAQTPARARVELGSNPRDIAILLEATGTSPQERVVLPNGPGPAPVEASKRISPPPTDEPKRVQNPEGVDAGRPAGAGGDSAKSNVPGMREPPPTSNPAIGAPQVRTEASSGNAKPSAVFGGLDIVRDNDAHIQLRLHLQGQAEARASMEWQPWRLIVDLPGAISQSTVTEWPVNHPLLSAVRAVVERQGLLRIVADLTRVVGYRVHREADGDWVVDLGLPRNAGRSLSEATVVIDPGHGGPSATGCWCVMDGHKVYEKDITLAVALKLREILADAGANVLMTRTTDVDVPLHSRPILANENSASLFVSIHVDEMPGSARPSGTTAYYHFDDAASRALAQAIVEHIAAVSGLPNRGARSDRTLYQNGLAVLRGSAVPATLVELAFLSNPNDRRKLVDPGFQRLAARAIADGIRAYLEGAAASEPTFPVPLPEALKGQH